MKPLRCEGGYAIPIKGGRFRLRGFCATVDDTSASSQLALVDDDDIKEYEKQGFVLGAIADKPRIVANKKGVANVDGTLEITFDEPIPIIHGLSAYFDNLVAGSVCVYVE